MSQSAKLTGHNVPPDLHPGSTGRRAVRTEPQSLDSMDDFESLVAQIMSRFMNASGDLDPLINQTLSELGRFLNVDRLTFFDVDSEERQMMPYSQWFSETAKDLRLEMGEDVTERFPWMTSKVLQGISLVVENTPSHLCLPGMRTKLSPRSASMNSIARGHSMSECCIASSL